MKLWEILERSRQENELIRAELAALKSSDWWQIRENWFELQRRFRDILPRFIFSLDRPTTWQVCDSNLLIVGWVFNSKKSIKAVRARIQNQSFVGVYGIERSDIALAYSNIIAAKNSGFTIELVAPPGQPKCCLRCKIVKVNGIFWQFIRCWFPRFKPPWMYR